MGPGSKIPPPPKKTPPFTPTSPCAEEDRKERRRKLGLPEELTEEEKAKEAARVEGEKKVAEAKKAAFVASIKPVTCERCYDMI